MADGMFSTVILIDVANQIDGMIAKCSMQIGPLWHRTIFDTVPQAINSVRMAIDESRIKFYKPDAQPGLFQKIERLESQSKPCAQSEIEQFLEGKAYFLGFFAVDQPTEIWAADPWDAHYIGVSTKELLLAMRVMRAKGLCEAGSSNEYARPSDELLARQVNGKYDDTSTFQSQQNISRLNLPTKEELIKDMQAVLDRNSIAAVLVIDLDHFKSVNDTKGHSEGDACLDQVVSTLATIVGRKGKIYRWGSGDEFALCLPDFSTEEALATAERVRRGIEEAKPGGDIVVTASIGVCASDRAESKPANEILDFADKAMYVSKTSGRNRVTTWPIVTDSATVATSDSKPAKPAIKLQLAAFLKEGREIQTGLHYSNFDCLRQKQDWEERVEAYLERNLDLSYAVRFQTPGHLPTTYPEGINSKMMAPWADAGAKMAMLNGFIAELRD